MRKIVAALIPVSIVGAFAAGAWCQDQRVHSAYVEQGRIAGWTDIATDAAVDYTGCLKDPPGCEQQLATYRYVRSRVEYHKLFETHPKHPREGRTRG